jgi:hypothetical protein
MDRDREEDLSIGSGALVYSPALRTRLDKEKTSADVLSVDLIDQN